MTTVNPIPDGYRTLTPYLAVPDGHAALDFYVRGLGAVIVDRMDAPDGTLMHAEIRIGDSMLQLSQEMPDFGLKAPEQGSAGAQMRLAEMYFYEEGTEGDIIESWKWLLLAENGQPGNSEIRNLLKNELTAEQKEKARLRAEAFRKNNPADKP